ncbi:MAG: AbgT family transporter [Caldilinea sp.]|nr:AbgT family transporter [Caldilinea sp.]MCB0041784.1 AbgT family transporter [Caldilinea sp.]MCB9114126.1 AbgT family transporter [Caldilineaceae bacterium]MCO5210810.1 AbgT family transporter [Caldilinea sp.]MCW5844583.1 AbgT family transporter [Caldilinea sp.]
MTTGTATDPGKRSFMDRLLDTVERVGNKVPHPVLMFSYLIIGVIVLSALLSLLGVSVTEQIAVPAPQEVTPDFYEDTYEYTLSGIGSEDVEFEIKEQTITINSLLSIDGIRFLFTSFVPNFQGFGALAVTLIAMMGAGAAEVAGLMAALIRMLVRVAPRALIAYLIVFIGALASVASDAGYLILIPLGGAAFLAVGRHPIAGLAAGFGGVAAAFMANLIPTPTDAMLFEITNEAIALTGGAPISITADYFFQAASTIFLTLIIGFVIVRVVEPRLGKYDPSQAGDPAQAAAADEIDPALEARGLRRAGIAFLGVLAVVLLATLPPGAPLRDPATGAIIGQTPFMSSLLFIVMLCFFIPGIAFGSAVGKYKGPNDVIAAVVKTFAGLGGLIFMLLMISQFIAYFNYSNLPSFIATVLAEWLGQAGIPAIPLLIGFVLVIVLLDFIIPGSLAKWAIFAPIFVPLFIRLGVPAQTVFAAYRVGDSPINTLTPLMVYFPVIVAFAQRYQKTAGVGSLVALMLPVAGVVLVAWLLFLIAWFLLGIPLGPGYPVSM